MVIRGARREFLGSLPYDALWGLLHVLSSDALRIVHLYGSLKRGRAEIKSVNFARDGGDPKVHIIRVGTIRQRDELVPKTQLWFRSSQRWLANLDGIAKLESQPAFNRSGAVT